MSSPQKSLKTRRFKAKSTREPGGILSSKGTHTSQGTILGSSYEKKERQEKEPKGEKGAGGQNCQGEEGFFGKRGLGARLGKLRRSPDKNRGEPCGKNRRASTERYRGRRRPVNQKDQEKKV